MFLASPGDVVEALDAATGELLCEYRYQYPEDAESRRATAAVVALDAPVGQSTRVDYRRGFAQTGGPSIVKGVVVSGINGRERVKDEGCFITGHDPRAPARSSGAPRPSPSRATSTAGPGATSHRTCAAAATPGFRAP